MLRAIAALALGLAVPSFAQIPVSRGEWAPGAIPALPPHPPCLGRYAQNPFFSVEVGLAGARFLEGAGGPHGFRRSEGLTALEGGGWTLQGEPMSFSSDCRSMDWTGRRFTLDNAPLGAAVPPAPAPFQNVAASLPQAVRRAAAAAAYLPRSGGDLSCTGFWVSSDGYLLTATHCLARTLRARAAAAVKSAPASPQQPVPAGALVLKDQAPGLRLGAGGTLANGVRIEGIDDFEPVLVAAGPAAVTKHPL